jgi:hypothetical protein
MIYLYTQASTKERLLSALTSLQSRTLSFTWDVSWKEVHNSNTSQLGGFKPSSRRDSSGARLYVVAIFSSSKKEMSNNGAGSSRKKIRGRMAMSLPNPPLIQATFEREPTTEEVVKGLIQTLERG